MAEETEKGGGKWGGVKKGDCGNSEEGQDEKHKLPTEKKVKVKVKVAKVKREAVAKVVTQVTMLLMKTASHQTKGKES